MNGEEDTPPAFSTCGVRLDAATPQEAARTLVATAHSGEGRAVHLCNAYTLSLAHRDPTFAAVLNRGDLNLIDGMPLVWIARRLGIRSALERVYGPDLMLEVLGQGRGAGLRHYLYGSTPEVVAALTTRLEQGIPGVSIVATESPPFRALTEDEEMALADRIRQSGADVVWVGLGTPKQDLLIDRLRRRVPAVLVGVGAAFDFNAGTKRQAPRWMRRAGLEWLFRLLTEPKRLWRRYLVGNTVFVIGALRTTRRGRHPG